MRPVLKNLHFHLHASSYILGGMFELRYSQKGVQNNELELPEMSKSKSLLILNFDPNNDVRHIRSSLRSSRQKSG